MNFIGGLRYCITVLLNNTLLILNEKSHRQANGTLSYCFSVLSTQVVWTILYQIRRNVSIFITNFVLNDMVRDWLFRWQDVNDRKEGKCMSTKIRYIKQYVNCLFDSICPYSETVQLWETRENTTTLHLQFRQF